MSAVEEYWKHPDHYRPCNICGAQPGTEHNKLCSAAGWQPKPEFRSYIERIAELEAENERLRVCGTCGHRDYSVAVMAYRCGEDGSPKHLLDHCHFPESRWTPYWEADDE